MVAKATPCGSTISAPERPAIRSARKAPRVSIGHQRRNGMNLAAVIEGRLIEVCAGGGTRSLGEGKVEY